MTVVIFFSERTKDSINSNCSTQYIKWPFITTHPHPLENEIVERICKTYSKLNVTKPLRIICIDAMGTKGEISGQTANSILKHLKTSLEKCIKSKKKSPFDVVFFPKFFVYSGQDAFEIMESLWYLREHVVLISNSSIHSALPTTEVIAVGAAMEQQNVQSRFSILDFLVTNSETKKTGETVPDKRTSLTEPDKNVRIKDWFDEDLIRPYGSAVVCAIALRILDCLQGLQGLQDVSIPRNMFLRIYYSYHICKAVRQCPNLYTLLQTFFFISGQHLTTLVKCIIDLLYRNHGISIESVQEINIEDVKDLLPKVQR